jgi:hypothetical protein
MHIFRDSEGREWPLTLTISSAKRVRDLVGADLLQPEAGDPPLLTRLGTDVVLLCDLVFALVKPQADERGISDEQFGQALGGAAVLAAQSALYEELSDFFREAGRPELTKAVAAQRNLIKRAIARIEKRLDNLDPDKVLDQTLGNPSGNSPGSSESTPAR